jgi:hypothetical protein
MFQTILFEVKFDETTSETEDDCLVHLTPLFEVRDDPEVRDVQDFREISIDPVLKAYIHFQLLQSGVIWELKKLHTKKPLYIVIVTIDKIPKITDHIFHDDEALFVINHYHHKDGVVLGTEILFENENKYDVEEVGRVALIQDEIHHLDIERKLEKTTLRGLYNSGSTLMWCDKLLTHGIPNPYEKIEDNILTLTFGNRSPLNVNVCIDRIKTVPEHLANRRLILLLILNEDTEDFYLGRVILGETFRLHFTKINTGISKINFSVEEYAEFLNKLNADHCFSFSSVNIRKFGGRSRKNKRKKITKHRLHYNQMCLKT